MPLAHPQKLRECPKPGGTIRQPGKFLAARVRQFLIQPTN